MTFGYNSVEDTRVNRKCHRRVHRVATLGCATISVVLALSSIVLYVMSQARYSVRGTPDPATGIGIEYTMAPRYVQKIDDSKSNHLYGFIDLEFTPSPPSPLIRWVHENILKGSSVAPESEGGNTITQTSSKHSKMWGWYVDSRGLVSIDSKQLNLASVVSQEYKMVGDCPTTLVVEDSDVIVNGHPMQYYNLLVRPREQTVIYVFQATGIEGRSPNPDLRELKSIRESIRVIKVK